MATQKGLPLAAMERLLHNPTGLRISEDAKAALKEELERHAEVIAKKAATFSQHARRRTIKEEDVALALKEL